MSKRIPKPKRKTLAKSGVVSLLLLTDSQSGSYCYAVEYPHKVGAEESGSFRMMSQFLKKDQAALEFAKMAKFFRGVAKGEGIGTCPKCGSVVSFRFMIHDCKPALAKAGAL